MESFIKELPHIDREQVRELLLSFLSFAKKVQKPYKKVNKPSLDPDQIDFSDFNRNSLLTSERPIEPNFTHLIMKKFERLKIVHGHQNKRNFHETLDPSEQTIPLYNILFDHEGKFLFTADDNGNIKVWSTFNMQLLF